MLDEIQELLKFFKRVNGGLLSRLTPPLNVYVSQRSFSPFLVEHELTTHQRKHCQTFWISYQINVSPFCTKFSFNNPPLFHISLER